MLFKPCLSPVVTSLLMEPLIIAPFDRVACTCFVRVHHMLESIGVMLCTFRASLSLAAGGLADLGVGHDGEAPLLPQHAREAGELEGLQVRVLHLGRAADGVLRAEEVVEPARIRGAREGLPLAHRKTVPLDEGLQDRVTVADVGLVRLQRVPVTTMTDGVGSDSAR
jgi:hypothetical protein